MGVVLNMNFELLVLILVRDICLRVYSCLSIIWRQVSLRSYSVTITISLHEIIQAKQTQSYCMIHLGRKM